MFIKIELESEVPIYMQLRAQIIQGIATGELKQGQMLPSVRALGSELGINLHTVNKAYNLLKEEGVLKMHRGKGAVVGNPKNDEVFHDKIRSELMRLAYEARSRGINEGDFAKIAEQCYKDAMAQVEYRF